SISKQCAGCLVDNCHSRIPLIKKRVARSFRLIHPYNPQHTGAKFITFIYELWLLHFLPSLLNQFSASLIILTFRFRLSLCLTLMQQPWHSVLILCWIFLSQAIITLLSVTLKSSSLNCWLRTALITLQNPLNLKPRGKCSHVVSALAFLMYAMNSLQ